MKKQAAATHNSNHCAFRVSCVSILASKLTVGVFAVGVVTGNTAATAALWSCGRAMGSKLLGYHQPQCMRCLKARIALCNHTLLLGGHACFFGSFLITAGRCMDSHCWLVCSCLLACSLVCMCMCVWEVTRRASRVCVVTKSGPKRI